MYLSKLCNNGCQCGGRCGQSLRGLSGMQDKDWANLALQAGAAYMTGGASLIPGAMGAGGGGGGGGSMPGVDNTVATSTNVETNVATNVSPNISPTFIQQGGGGNAPISVAQPSIPQQFAPMITGQDDYFATPEHYAPRQNYYEPQAAQNYYDPQPAYQSARYTSPNASEWIPGIKNEMLIFGSVGLGLIALLLKKRSM